MRRGITWALPSHPKTKPNLPGTPQATEAAVEAQLSTMSSVLESLCSNPVNRERLYVTDTLVRR